MNGKKKKLYFELRAVQARLKPHNHRISHELKFLIDFNSFIKCVCAVKEVEYSAELSSNLYQRQLAAERRKTVSVLEENQTLQEALEELTRKLRVSNDNEACS